MRNVIIYKKTSLVLGVIILLHCVVLLSCSENDCLIADQINIVKRIKSENKQLVIIEKISGGHEKIIYYEVYAASVKFDLCGKANTNMLAGDSIDGKHSSVNDVNYVNGKLVIEYKK